MSDTALVIVLLVAALGLGLPVVMVGFSRLPRMDQDGDDFGVQDEPSLQWPPTEESRAQAKRLGWVLAAWAGVFVLLLFALLISLGLV